MAASVDSVNLQTLRDYASGLLGTGQTIERTGLHDYADLIIAMAQNDLEFPKPNDTPKHRAQFKRASLLLQPLLSPARSTPRGKEATKA